MASKQQVATADSTKLALIYSRLAELEVQKKKKTTIGEEISKRFSASDLDPLEIANIDVIFKDVSQQLTDASTAQSADAVSEAISRLRLLFLAEHQFTETLQSSFPDKIKKVEAFRSEQDGHASEAFRLREEIMKLQSRNEDLEELCRNLQNLAREKDAHRQQLVENERLKSEHLEAECVQSIATVSKKIEQEEEELVQKEQENASLREKLQEFQQHLNLRKEKRQNEVRAQELQRQLRDARRAQAAYVKEQESLRRTSTKARIQQMEETVNSLRHQLTVYASKFEEFESTLSRSVEVLEKINERQVSLSQIASKLQEENAFLKSRAGETDVQVIMAMEQRRTLEQDLAALKTHYEKMEKKCRKLLTRRQELMKESKPQGAAAEKTTVDSNTSETAASVQSSAKVPGSTPTGRLKTPSPTHFEEGASSRGPKAAVASSSSAVASPSRVASSSSSSSSSSSAGVSHHRQSPSNLEGGVSSVGDDSPATSPATSLRKPLSTNH